MEQLTEIELKDAVLTTEFVLLCQQQNIRKIAEFFQSNFPFLIGRRNLRTEYIKACANIQNDAAIALAEFSFANLFRVLKACFESTHPDFAETMTDGSAHHIELSDFREIIASSEPQKRSFLEKKMIRYFLLSCQLDAAFALNGCADQRQRVLGIALQKDKDQADASYFCACGEPHTAIIQRKINDFPTIDIDVEQVAAAGDLEGVTRRLDQGAAALRGIAGAAHQSDIKMMIQITQLYANDFTIAVPTLELLANAKKDDLFSQYLSFIQKTNINWITLKELLLTYALNNGLVTATLSLLRDQAATLSLPIDPDQFQAEEEEENVFDVHFESVLRNLSAEPQHHRKMSKLALAIIKGKNQHELEIAINRWQRIVEFYYRCLEELIIKDDVTDIINVMNSYGIDYRLALKGAIMAERCDILEKLFAAIREPFKPGLVMNITEAKSFCGYVACKNGKIRVIDYLHHDKGYKRKKIAIDAAAAANVELFDRFFSLNDFPLISNLNQLVFHLVKAGWNDKLITLLQNMPMDKRIPLSKAAVRVALANKNYSILSALITVFNYKPNIIFTQQPSERDLLHLLSLTPLVHIIPIINSFVTAGYITDAQSINARLTKIKSVMTKQKFDFDEAYACIDVGIQVWFLEGFKVIPAQPYLILCSYLLGKDAKDFQPKFYQMIHGSILRHFLDNLYGHENWEKNEENGNTYYQQKTEEETVKKARLDKTMFMRLEPYSTRLNKNLFFQLPLSSAEVKTEPQLKHKAFSKK